MLMGKRALCQFRSTIRLSSTNSIPDGAAVNARMRNNRNSLRRAARSDRSTGNAKSALQTGQIASSVSIQRPQMGQLSTSGFEESDVPGRSGTSVGRSTGAGVGDSDTAPSLSTAFDNSGALFSPSWPGVMACSCPHMGQRNAGALSGAGTIIPQLGFSQRTVTGISLPPHDPDYRQLACRIELP